MLGKVNGHILPLFCCLAMLCYLDRVNLAFAARQLNEDLGFSKAVYGLGSGAAVDSGSSIADWHTDAAAMLVPSQLASTASEVGLGSDVACRELCRSNRGAAHSVDELAACNRRADVRYPANTSVIANARSMRASRCAPQLFAVPIKLWARALL